MMNILTNNSNADISLYFYVTNVDSATYTSTNLELKGETGIVEELNASAFNHGESDDLFNSSIMAVKGKAIKSKSLTEVLQLMG